MATPNKLTTRQVQGHEISIYEYNGRYYLVKDDHLSYARGGWKSKKTAQKYFLAIIYFDEIPF